MDSQAPSPEATGVAAWLALAAEPTIVRRALKYAIVVGAVLISINHGDAILHGDMSSGRVFRMALTVLVPYAVSTASSVAALREARARSRFQEVDDVSPSLSQDVRKKGKTSTTPGQGDRGDRGRK